MQSSPEVFVSAVNLSIMIHQQLGQLRVAIGDSKHQGSPEIMKHREYSEMSKQRGQHINREIGH